MRELLKCWRAASKRQLRLFLILLDKPTIHGDNVNLHIRNMKGRRMKTQGFMKGGLKLLALATAFALCVVAFAGCASEEESDGYTLVEDGKLTVASSLDFPPFESLDGDTPTGFDIAVIQEVAKRMGLECNIKNTKFDTILPAINSGQQFDVGISSITMDPDREEMVDFSTPYYIADQAVVVVKDTYKTVDELKGLKLGAQSGTTGYYYGLEVISDDVTPYDEATACFAALQSGNVQGVVIDLAVAESMVKNAYPNCEIIEKVATGEEYGIAVNKNNKQLTTAINDALDSMEKDGTLEALQEQYLAS